MLHQTGEIRLFFYIFQLNSIHQKQVKIKEAGNMRKDVICAANNERFNIAVKPHFLLVADKHHVREARLDDLRQVMAH